MKLSFSTRGWGYENWEDAVNDASDYHFSGIEIYNFYGNPALTDRNGPFHPYHTAQTVRQMREFNLEISCFDSAIDLSAEQDPTQQVIELVNKAHDVCCPYVSVRVNSENNDIVTID